MAKKQLLLGFQEAPMAYSGHAVPCKILKVENGKLDLIILDNHPYHNPYTGEVMGNQLIAKIGDVITLDNNFRGRTLVDVLDALGDWQQFQFIQQVDGGGIEIYHLGCKLILDPEERALLSLAGLSVGDALGERFFDPHLQQKISDKEVPSGTWKYTDDTHMALSLVETLQRHGRVDQDFLARRFVERFREEPNRGYADGAIELLRGISSGESWQVKAGSLFGGRGSYGNGAAMRVAPLGAYFADNLVACVNNARLSAEVTHTHPEGIAGAIAIAVASALAHHVGEGYTSYEPNGFLKAVLQYVPDGEVKDGVRRAMAIPSETLPTIVARELGSGSHVSAQDTVPFTLWVAAHHLRNYQDAFWTTVSGLGDRDTTCAIVGGIVALSSRKTKIPPAWLQHREELPPGFSYSSL